MTPGYTYRVATCEVLDGDTVRLVVDLGLEVSIRDTFRLAGIDTPEKRGPQAVAAAAATARLKELCQRVPLTVRTEKTKAGEAREKFGRYLAHLFPTGSLESVNEILIQEGHAKPYFGGKKA